MNREEKIQQFLAWEKKLESLQMALTIIGIDSVDVPPSQGNAYRSEHLSILYGEHFKMANDPAMFEILEELKDDENIDYPLRRRISLYAKNAEKQKAIPADEYIAYQNLLSRSESAWLEAKATSNYRDYAPILKDVFAGYAKQVSHRDSPLPLYDQILEDHEPGMTMEKYDAFFQQVKERCIPLIQQIQKAKPIDTSLFEKEYDIAKQKQFMAQILQYVGFTKDWGKMSESEHPLTTGVSKGDIRFTTHYRLNNPVDSVLSTIHESGHAWFGHNIDSKYDGTILQHSISAALHESQSRFCENHLGRSKAFWTVNYPSLQALYPEQLGNVTFDTFYRAINAVEPSLIRTQADELTYPLHIVIRYEIEKAMFDGSLQAEDLEEAWNTKYREYLGVEVPDAAHGILQDMHWPYAYFGYFPTYALGSAYSAQFYHTMVQQINPDQLMLENRYTEIMKWLEEHIQTYGNLYDPSKIIVDATGEPFNPSYYLDYLTEKYTKLYHLD